MLSSLFAFLPQLGLSGIAGLALGQKREDLLIAFFTQTVIFVTFNKVCTSQVRRTKGWPKYYTDTGNIAFSGTFGSFTFVLPRLQLHRWEKLWLLPGLLPFGVTICVSALYTRSLSAHLCLTIYLLESNASAPAIRANLLHCSQATIPMSASRQPHILGVLLRIRLRIDKVPYLFDAGYCEHASDVGTPVNLASAAAIR